MGITDTLPREVDAERATLLLVTHQFEHALDYPAIDARDRVITLRRGQEGAGRNQLALLPDQPDQHLDMRVLTVRDRGPDLLRHQCKASVFDGVIQAMDPVELLAARRQRRVARLDDLDPVPALVLRRVAGRVGCLEDLGIIEVFRRRIDHADTHADTKDLALPVKPKRLHGLQNLARDTGRLLQIHVGQENREFVAADTGDEIALAQHATQAVGELPQELVTRGVPTGIVHHLEAVEVHHAQGMRGVARIHGQCRGHLGLELDAIEKPGERIDLGLALDLAGHDPLLGHIVKGRDRALEPALGTTQWRER